MILEFLIAEMQLSEAKVGTDFQKFKKMKWVSRFIFEDRPLLNL